MITPEFKEAYGRLNPEQRKAVDTIEGPVMVVAGPGTGKTEVLTLRIANILLQTDTKPEQILALTFTEAASSNMRKRLSKVIGAPAYRVRIQTFHSFCNDVLQSYPEFFPHIVGGSPVTEIESTSIVENIIKDGQFSVLRPWGEPMLYVGDILRKIEHLKREGVSVESFKNAVDSADKEFQDRTDLYHEKGAHKGKMKSEAIEQARKIEKNKELSKIYEIYQKELFANKLYDWSDMIMEVLTTLKDPKKSDLKIILQEEHQYILVDEHQDTNNAQNSIVEIISDFHENPNIFVVGDSKQAIFRFQGASVENFLYFKNLYPQAVLIDLFRNYRSTQTILDSAHSIISSETKLVSASSNDSETGFADFSKKKNTVSELSDSAEERILPRVPLVSERTKGTLGNEADKIKIISFKNPTLERFWIAKTIDELRREDGQDAVIIYRSNREAFPMVNMLSKFGIPYSIESDEDLLGDKYVKKLVAILEAVNNYGDDASLISLLHVEELGVDLLQSYRLIRTAKNKKKTIYEILTQDDEEELSFIKEKLETWLMKSRELSLPEFMEFIFRDAGLLDSALKSRDADAFLGIEKIFEEAQRMSMKKVMTLDQFVQFLSTLKEHNLFIKKPKRESKEGVVRLMTAHRAKGLEFDHVFIMNASEKSFGSKVNRDKLPLIDLLKANKPKVSLVSEGTKGTLGLAESPLATSEESLEDERRLFYVALTRAKKNIFISYYENDESGKEVLPSVFISELKEDLVEKLDTSDFEEEVEKDRRLLYAESKSKVIRDIDKEFVNELFYKEQFSVTSLNNYLECPWKYFYRNLLRIPEVQAKYLIYGTAMHATVEDFLKERLKNNKIEKDRLIDIFVEKITSTALSESEMQESMKKGKESLSVWFDERNESWGMNYVLEKPLYGVEFPDHTGNDIKLSGKIDKIEFIDGSEVVVTDYKTGKPKSRNEIEGKTGDKTGNYKRQLVFYKLLLDLFDEGRYNMTRGIIEFLEPTESGNIKYEEFDIEEKEVDDLKFTIEKVVNEITSLSFWDKYCDEPKCEYCAFRKLLDK